MFGHDPLLTQEGVRSLGFEPAPELLSGYDIAVMHSYHAAYAATDWRSLAPILLDARNAVDRAMVEAAGVSYVGIGRPLHID